MSTARTDNAMINDILIRLVRATDYVEAREVVQHLLENRSLIETAKPILAELYLEGNEAQKRCVVDGILEHLFEVPGIDYLFSEWRFDAELNVALVEAQRWAELMTRKQAFLSQVATLCAEEMRRQGITDARVKSPEIGVDSIEIEWGGGEDSEHLILDCDYEEVEKFMTDAPGTRRLAKYAADRNWWVPDEYAPWQQWVYLTDLGDT
jgi:hypothetical protein